jgi:nucleoside-diphosphate-sugar epimerase
VILVTGANGFIGRHMVEALEKAGVPRRALLSRPNAGFTQRFPKVPTVCGDLLDEAVLREALDGVETIIHLAAKNIDHDDSGFERVNVEGTRLLCRLATKFGVARVLYLSSVGVYGHGAHRDSDESTRRHPDTPFSRSKAAAEDLVLNHHRGGDFTALVLRHRFVYGEGDGAVLPRLIKAARKYRFWIGGGKARMSLVSAPDLAAVLHYLATAPTLDLDPEPVYHITDGHPLTYRQLITEICHTFGYPVPRVSIPFFLLYTPVRLREILLSIDPEVSTSSITSIRLKFVAQDNSFSNRKLARLLGDFSFTPFAEGFSDAFQYYSTFAGSED